MNVPEPMFPDARRDDFIAVDKNPWIPTIPSIESYNSQPTIQSIASQPSQHESQIYRTEAPQDAPSVDRGLDLKFNAAYNIMDQTTSSQFPTPFQASQCTPPRTSVHDRYSPGHLDCNDYNQVQRTPTQEERQHDQPQYRGGISSAHSTPLQYQPTQRAPPRNSAQHAHKQFGNSHPQVQRSPMQEVRQNELPHMTSHSPGYDHDQHDQRNNYLNQSGSHDGILQEQRPSQNYPTAPYGSNGNGNGNGRRRSAQINPIEYGEQAHTDRTFQKPLGTVSVMGQPSYEQNQQLDSASNLTYSNPRTRTRSKGSENQFRNANGDGLRREDDINMKDFSRPRARTRHVGSENQFRNANGDGLRREDNMKDYLHARSEDNNMKNYSHQFRNTNVDELRREEDMKDFSYASTRSRFMGSENQFRNANVDELRREEDMKGPREIGTALEYEDFSKDEYQRREGHLRPQMSSRKNEQQRGAFSPNHQIPRHTQTPQSNSSPLLSQMPHGGDRPRYSQFPERQYQQDDAQYPIQPPFSNKTLRDKSPIVDSADNRHTALPTPSVGFHDRELNFLKEIRSTTEMQKSAANEIDRCFWTKQLDILKKDLEELQEQNERGVSSQTERGASSVTSVVTGRADSVQSTDSRFSVIQVRAPKNLPGGYLFKAKVDGKAVKGTVPQGGVTMGEIFPVSVTVKDQISDTIRVEGVPVALSVKKLNKSKTNSI